MDVPCSLMYSLELPVSQGLLSHRVAGIAETRDVKGLGHRHPATKYWGQHGDMGQIRAGTASCCRCLETLGPEFVPEHLGPCWWLDSGVGGPPVRKPPTTHL